MMSFTPEKSWIHEHVGPPLAIAHRGASAYACDNTIRAFQVAHQLGADMWEVDVRLTSDGVPVAFHDEDLQRICGLKPLVSELTADELIALTRAAGREAPLFSDVARLAGELETGIYLDAKEGQAASRAMEHLVTNRIEKVIVGANTPDYCSELVGSNCPYPVSILVGLDLDPFKIARDCRAQIVHPCWERAGDRPDRLLDGAFFRNARALGLPVVTWHEERAEVLAELVKMPVLGICSDRPEMVSRHALANEHGPEIVCHRGACRIAPGNTLASAEAAWGAGFDYVEIDVRQARDGCLVVHHDDTLDRTTTGSGPLAAQTHQELEALDAGSSFDPFFAGEGLPALKDMLQLAETMDGKLYVEIKDADAVLVAKTVLAQRAYEDVFFWSLNQDDLKAIREACPQANLMARPEDYNTLEACLNAFGADIIEFNARNATLDGLAAVRAAGRKVMLAYMGDSRDVLSAMLRFEPDLLNVNEPFLVQRMRLQAKKQSTA